MPSADRLLQREGGPGGRQRRRERLTRPTSGEWEAGLPELRTRGGEVTASTPTVHGREGNRQTRELAKVMMSTSDCSYRSHMQVNTLAFELAQESSRRASGASAKRLIDNETMEGMWPRRHSPGIVAKLMGLDTLPVQQNQHRRNELMPCLHKGSSESFPRKFDSYGFRDSHKDFKDVFEVMATAEKPGNWPTQKKLSKARKRQRKIDFIRQKFMYVKQSSADEKLRSSKQFYEALQVLESNKNLFLKLLQEPSSLFAKHLEEYQSYSTTPESSHSVILKSHVTDCEINDLHRRSERKEEKRISCKRNFAENYEEDFVSHCIKEHNTSLSKKLKKRVERKTDNSHPTNIVVLTPNLENGQEMAYHENLQFYYSDYRRHRELRSVTRESSPEFEGKKKYDDGVILTQRVKGSRKFAKIISRQMINTVPGNPVKARGLGCNLHPRYKHAHRTTEASNFMDFGMLRSSDQVENTRNFAYSTEISVSREARRRLSKIWKTNQKSLEDGTADQRPSTLGEMLAISNNKMSGMPSSSVNYQEGFWDEVSGKGKLARWGYPSGVSSWEAWKRARPSSFRGPKSFPASPNVFTSTHRSSDNYDISMLKNGMNHHSRKSSEGSVSNEVLSPPYENIMMVSDTPQHPNRAVHGIDSNAHSSLGTIIDQEYPNDHNTKIFEDPESRSRNSDAIFFIGSEPVACGDSAAHEQFLLHPIDSVASADTELSIIRDQKVAAAKEASFSDHPSTESFPSSMRQACTSVLEVDEQTSPVSVLDPPDVNEASPGCFESLQSDLKELRVRLGILKSASRDADDGGLVSPSGLHADVGFDGVPQDKEDHPTSNDEDDIVFRYLREVLACSDFQDNDWDTLFCVWFSTEAPIRPDVFEKLEEMYGRSAWPQIERKLLFDHINSALVEILAPTVNPQPRIKPSIRRSVGVHNLADEVWRWLVRERRGAAGGAGGVGVEDPRWLDLGNDADTVGRGIEKALYDDLVEEIIHEVRGSDTSVYACRHCGRNSILSA